MEEIRKMRRYFGVHGEEFNILKSMAVSIRGMLKLNIITALFVITGSVCRLLDLFCVPGVKKNYGLEFQDSSSLCPIHLFIYAL